METDAESYSSDDESYSSDDHMECSDYSPHQTDTLEDDEDIHISNLSFYGNEFSDVEVIAANDITFQGFAGNDITFEGFSQSEFLSSTVAPVRISIQYSSGSMNNDTTGNGPTDNTDSFANIPEPTWVQPAEHVPVIATRADTTPPFDLSEGNINIEYEFIREGSRNKRRNGENADVIVSTVGHHYTFYRMTSGKNSGKAVFRCVNANTKAKINCKAQLVLDFPVDEHLSGLKPKNHHSQNCLMQPSKAELLIFIRDCKEYGKLHPYMKSSVVLEYQSSLLPRDIPRDHFLSDKKMKKIINHYRSKFRPRPPKADELLTFSINPTGMPNDFFRGDVLAGPPSDRRRHFVFATDQQLNSLRDAEGWTWDATYKITKAPHTQLLSIHGRVGNPGEEINTPLCYVLMSGKRTDDYVIVLEFIKALLERDGREIRLRCVLMDYEAALWSSIKSVFGIQVRRRGCWFHFSSCIYKRVREWQLEKDYYKKQAVYTMVR